MNTLNLPSFSYGNVLRSKLKEDYFILRKTFEKIADYVCQRYTQTEVNRLYVTVPRNKEIVKLMPISEESLSLAVLLLTVECVEARLPNNKMEALQTITAEVLNSHHDNGKINTLLTVFTRLRVQQHATVMTLSNKY